MMDHVMREYRYHEEIVLSPHHSSLPMSSPRIVRRNTESPKEIMISKKIHISLWRVLCTLWSCLRVAVRTIWYWFQRIFLIVFLLSLTIGLAWWLSQKPSNLRDWNPSESILPAIVWSGNIASIQNVRNYQWTSESISTPGYYDSIYDLDKIESLYYMIVPFSNFDGPAHTMLSFGFADGKKVVISAEIRKERGESFDALK